MIWALLYIIVGYSVYVYWCKHIAHKYNSQQQNAAMMPGIVLLWPLVLFYYREYL